VVLAYPNWVEAYRSDRFTGWVASPGTDGYLLPTYNYDTLVAIAPVTGSAAPSSPGVPGWIWAVVAGAGVLVVAGLALRGRRRIGDEDV
jgi:peptide/nickel transport system substrate-binding protein